MPRLSGGLQAVERAARYRYPVQTGSYQNPPDMNGDTYKIVRFREGRHENGKPYWNFFTDMCRHCVNPPCVLAADEGP